MSVLTSRDNPKVKRWGKLAGDPRYRRSEKRALIEGPHLLAAALQQGCKPLAVLATQEGAADAEISRLIAQSGLRPILMGKGVLRSVVDAETPLGVAAEIAIPAPTSREATHVVFLEGVQDPGNVGAIMRSAAAFGVQRVILDPACADPWSPKALRAGMGGHFALQVAETRDLAGEIDAFKGTVACTVPRGGVALRGASLERSWAWIFGGEGRGLGDETIARADLRVTIPMSPGTESLNVAAAAAICLYEGFSRSAA
ncbi:MAG TPA: RNA methyltransferase [Burkholderiales bacterium]|nr:RNA methyltransferase [Burkholderiales bacterium]